MPDADGFLTAAEIPAMLKLNQQTTRNWIEAGRIPHYRLGQSGRRVPIRRSDFDAFIANAEPKREPVEPRLSIWDGEIHMPVSP